VQEHLWKGGQDVANTPVRMLTGTAARTDSTSSTAFVNLVPTPGHKFSTTAVATLTALFVAECRVGEAGARLEVQIVVDGVTANPGTAVLTVGKQYETRSHLAFRTNIPAGTHTVTVQWRVSAGSAYVRNRSFTVWEVR
jgi:hypothetical protein